MKHLAPAAAAAFRCAAASCSASCCRAGWQIVVDEATARTWRTLPGQTGDRARAALTDEDGESILSMPGGVCALLDPDGLCAVQRQFGHAALCKVCRDYPRFVRVFGALTEHGVSLSCPTAYRLATAEPPRWTQWEDDAPVVPHDIDAETWLRLREGRAKALDLLANEVRPVEARLRALLLHAARLQRSLPCACTSVRRTAPRRSLHGWAGFFASLEPLDPGWPARLQNAPLRRTVPAETAVRWLWYNLYKYWLDALDDGDLLGRVKRSVVCTLLGSALEAAEAAAPVPVLCQMSRELEHSEENLAALLEWVRGVTLSEILSAMG